MSPAPSEAPPLRRLHIRVMMWLWKLVPLIVLVGLIYLTVVLAGVVAERRAAKEAGRIKPVLAHAAGEVVEVLVEPGQSLMLGQPVVKIKLPGEAAVVKKPEKLPFPVSVMVVKPQRFVDRIVLPGVVTANKDVSVSAEVRGTLIDRRVAEGQRVKKGELIAAIDDRDFKDALDRTQAALVLAQSTYSRAQKLAQTGAATQAELDAANAQLSQAKAQKSEAETRLKRAMITSPIDGTVDKLHVELGELIEDGALVARIIDASEVKINIAIPEADVKSVYGLEEVEFRVDSATAEKMRGKVQFVTLAPAEGARVYMMELRVDNPNGRLRPGMIVKANVVRQEIDKGIVAPLFAVIPGDTGYSAVVEKDGIAHRRAVKLGPLRGQEVLILEGLKAEDRLVVQGQRQVENGQKVRAIRTVKSVEELLK